MHLSTLTENSVQKPANVPKRSKICTLRFSNEYRHLNRNIYRKGKVCGGVPIFYCLMYFMRCIGARDSELSFGRWVVSICVEGVRWHPHHTFQKWTQKTSGGHELRGLRQCAKKAPFHHTGKKHATLATLSRIWVDLIGAEIGVDMNPFVGDYGFVVNEQVDALKRTSGKR